MKNQYRMSKKMLISSLIGLGVFTFITFGVGIVFTLPFAIYFIISYFKNVLEIGEKGVSLSKGWLNTTHIEIPFSKINSVTVKRDFMGGMLGYGNIAILSGNDLRGEIFKGIEDPQYVKNEIMKQVDNK